LRFSANQKAASTLDNRICKRVRALRWERR